MTSHMYLYPFLSRLLEEAFDDACGIYYIDHVTQTHFLEGPWEESVRNQVLALHEHLAEEAKVLEDQMELARIKKEELENAHQKVEELETTRLRIEREISRLHNRNNDADGAEAEALNQEEEQVIIQYLR